MSETMSVSIESSPHFKHHAASRESSMHATLASDRSGASVLRHATASIHAQVERALGFPDTIRNKDDYRRCLVKFYGMYRPLEIRIGRFLAWSDWNIVIKELEQSRALSRDMTALCCNVPSVKLATDGDLPTLESFGKALGALYVLEGSRQGGRSILANLAGRMSAEIVGANAFFTGHGDRTGPMWAKFRTSLDRFAIERPSEFPDVIEGARATFSAFHAWMCPQQKREPS